MRLIIVITLSTFCPSSAAAQVNAPPPESQQIENLRAFAKLYGYVRYFHPSDEAAALDWDAFAIHGARQVRAASDAAQLERVLSELFRPVAPTMQITGSSEQVAASPALSLTDTSELEVVAWQHMGLGDGTTNNVYRSLRTNRSTTLTGGAHTGVLVQVLDATPLRSTEVRFTGWGRAVDPDALAHLWLRVDGAEGTSFFDNMMDRPVRTSDWSRMEILAEVDADASHIVFGTLVRGGAVAYDGLRLEQRTSEGWQPVAFANPGFEAADSGTGGVAGWQLTTPGWTPATQEGDAPEGDRFLVVERSKTEVRGLLFPEHARPGDMIHEPVGSGLTAHVPLALWSRDGRTIGASSADELTTLQATLARVAAAEPDAGDVALRAADVVILWNVMQHFYPYHDAIEADWDAILTTALERALAGPDRASHLATVQWMVHELDDGHGFVTDPEAQPLAGLPFRVNWIEEHVVVVRSEDPSVQVGDVILGVGGEATGDLLEADMAVASGTERWRRSRALMQFGQGTPGAVDVRVLRDGAEHTISVQRGMRGPGPVPEAARPAMIEEIEEGIYYVDLARASIDTINSQMEVLAVARGVIFDMRGYPQGNHAVLTHLTDEPIQSAHFLVPHITRPDGAEPRGSADGRWNLDALQPRITGTVVFLTDERAISYAESVMGIVEHYRLGEIVGGPTAGANGNVNRITLPGGYSVSWTGMIVVKHDGSQHHLVGIQPTIPAEPTIEGVRAGRDEVLERGLEVIRGRPHT